MRDELASGVHCLLISSILLARLTCRRRLLLRIIVVSGVAQQRTLIDNLLIIGLVCGARVVALPLPFLKWVADEVRYLLARGLRCLIGLLVASHVLVGDTEIITTRCRLKIMTHLVTFLLLRIQILLLIRQLHRSLIWLYLRVELRPFTLCSLLGTRRHHKLIAERAFDAAIYRVSLAAMHKLLVRPRIGANARDG